MALISKPISEDPNNPITAMWGVVACEYELKGSNITIGGLPVGAATADLQDLVIAIGKHRAIVIEGEVAPQATRIRNRNAELDEYGKCLADLTNFQAGFDKDFGGNDDGTGFMPLSVKDTLSKLGYSCKQDDGWGKKKRDEREEFYYTSSEGCSAKKRFIEGAIQRVKSKIDGLNNEAQLDMQRLQQLTDRRDEAYSATTNLMTSVSDTRSTVIRNY